MFNLSSLPRRSRVPAAAAIPPEWRMANRPLQLARAKPHTDGTNTCSIAERDALEGVGWHDVAAAVGLHPTKTAMGLWLVKSGRGDTAQSAVMQEDISTDWTRMFEPLVAAHYARSSGRRVRRVNSVDRHPEHPWMFTVIEWEVLDDAYVDLLSYLFVGPESVKRWTMGVPDHVRIQAMHTLAVTGRRAIDLAVLVCGQELQVHRITRDELVITRLQALEETFWRHVERDVPPPAEGLLQAGVVRQVLCAAASSSSLSSSTNVCPSHHQ